MKRISVISDSGTFILNGRTITLPKGEYYMDGKIVENATVDDMTRENVTINEIDDQGVLVLGSNDDRISVMDYIFSDSQESPVKDVKSKEEKIIDSLMPASGMLADYDFSPNHRLPNESDETFKTRRRINKAVFKLRMKEGINQWPADKGQFTDPLKQQRKALRTAKKANRVPISRLKRIEMGIA